MLLQTNSYVVPRDKRAEHGRLLRKFRQTLARLGCDHFEVYEQVGSNWSSGETTGRFVQIMRFRDRRHQQAVQASERSDPAAQALIQEFCELINFPYQQQQGLFAVGFYTSALPIASPRSRPADLADLAGEDDEGLAPEAEAEAEAEAGVEADVEPMPGEDELVVEAHEAASVAPATPTSPSEDDTSLGSLAADVEQSDLAEEEPAPLDVPGEGEGFMSEELALEESPPQERSDLPDSLDLDDLAELGGGEPDDDKPRST